LTRLKQREGIEMAKKEEKHLEVIKKISWRIVMGLPPTSNEFETIIHGSA